MSNGRLATLEAIVAQLKTADWKGREALQEQLRALFAEGDEGGNLQAALESARRELPMEARWDVDEILEELKPPPAPEPEPDEPEEDAEDPNRPLRMSDLEEVYADPRGIALFTDKAGKRWFLQQVDPYTGQPMLAEIPPNQVPQIKAQLQGSPYWRIGAGKKTGLTP
jgi:hypothetical protein